jgi:predicted transcriptional regulator
MVPVFILRSRIRELLEAGFVKETGERYQATEAGKAKV